MNATVVIPTHNGAARIGGLLDSLGGDTEIIVVDNASTDGTRELLASAYPHVRVLSLPRNEGFSRAVNRAARIASGDALVLVNDDCICEPGFVERLASALHPADELVMASGVLLEAGDPATIDSAGMELDDTLLVFDHLNGEPVETLADAPPPFGPSGAAAAFDRAAFLGIGGFDENLFAYWEDVDLVLRLRLAGGRCATAFDARAVHSHSATLGSGSARKNYLTGFGRGYVLRKWSVLTRSSAARVLSRELAICVAQLVVDRTITGFAGRVAGWRAACVVPRRRYPAAAVSGGRRGLIDELRRRGSRRRRLEAVKPV